MTNLCPGTDFKSVPLKPQSRGQSKITPNPATDRDNEDFTLTPKSGTDFKHAPACCRRGSVPFGDTTGFPPARE